MNNDELVESLRNELKQKGILRSITSQLKKEICTALTSRSFSSGFQYKSNVSTTQSIEHGAIRSLVFDFLLHGGMDCTLSVFSTESGLDGNYLSSTDICKAFEIHSGSILSKILLKKTTQGEEITTTGRRMEQSMLYQLLTSLPRLLNDVCTQCSSTQTANTVQADDNRVKSSMLASLDLDQQLQAIKKKYSSNISANQTVHHSSVLESNMFALQRECEEQAQKKMKVEMKEFKRTALASLEQQVADRYLGEIEKLKQMMKIECEQKLEFARKKKEQLSKDILFKEREREMQHMTDMHKLMREMDELKKKNLENENKVEIERRKLRLEEQRVEHILMNAESKLEFAEVKEREVRESIANEFCRVRQAAKQTYDDASESVQKQMVFYGKELEGLNALRKEASDQMNSNEVLRVEASELRVENKELKSHLDAVNTNIGSLNVLVQKVKEECNSKVAALRSQLLDTRKSEEYHRNEAMSRHEIYEQYRAITEPRIQDLQADLQRMKVENQLSTEEVLELRRLLMQSEGALQNLHSNTGNENNIRNERDVRDITHGRTHKTVEPQVWQSSRKEDEHVIATNDLTTMNTKYLEKCSLPHGKPIHKETSSMNPDSRPPSTPVHSQMSAHHQIQLPISPSPTPLNYHQGDPSSKPPPKAIIRPLSDILAHVNGTIDREEGSVHSLDTFLTWETAKPNTTTGNIQIRSPTQCDAKEIDKVRMLSDDQEKTGEDADDHERVEALTNNDSSQQSQDLFSENDEEEDVDYGSDFEVDSTQDCS